MQAFTKKHKGFTLIELLVVIAIIGILSSIVLVSVNTARNKAKDAAIKANLSQARTAAEMWYDRVNGGNYTGFCADTSWTTISTAITAQGSTDVDCVDTDPQKYCVSATLINTGAYCADSSGKTGTLVCGAGTACPSP